MPRAVDGRKVCSKCKVEKSVEAFSKNKKYCDGLQCHCKGCKREYRENNRERISKYGKEYRENNKERILEYMGEYSKKNKERILERMKEYNKRNKKRFSAIRARRKMISVTCQEV